MNILDEFRGDLNKYRSVAESYADNQLSRLRSNAEKKIRDVQRRLDNLDEDSEEFRENITEDSNVMDKYSQKIYEQVQDTLDRIELSDNISLRTLNRYVESIRDALKEQDKILVKYIKLLKDRKYKGRVKSLDKSLNRLLKDLKALEEFIKTEYAPSAGVESSSGIILESLELIDEYEEHLEALISHEEEVLEKYEELDKVEKELNELKNHPTKSKYEAARETYKEVQRDVDYAFSNIRKVFRKYDKYVSKNDTSTDTKLLSDMVTDAASAMAHQASISGVESLLKEIKVALDDTALNLSRDKRENAKEDIEKFLSGKLQDYYDKSTKVVKRKEKLEKELEALDLDSKIETVERNLAAVKRDAKRIYRRNLRALMDTRDEIAKNLSELKPQLEKISDDEITLTVKLPDLPDWVQTREK